MLTSAQKMERFSRPLFSSVLAGVSASAWDAFVRALSTSGMRTTAVSGAVGSFELRPRRLGEIGVLTNMRRDAGGRWVGDFVAPYSEESIRLDANLQYEIFALSMKRYDDELSSLVRPEGASRSGCLAILHCGGRGALKRWPEGAFDTTKAIFDRANKLF